MEKLQQNFPNILGISQYVGKRFWEKKEIKKIDSNPLKYFNEKQLLLSFNRHATGNFVYRFVL
jgi:hypothetical protein